jgi:hypothetical protein
MAACSGDGEMVDRLGGLDQDITSTASTDNSLEFCFQMCNQSGQSCELASKVCDISADYPSNGPLAARCEVTRERCRTHRTKVPRQCVCDTAVASPGS